MSKSIVTLGSFLALFLLAMIIVWAPYPGSFNAIILGGPSNNLLQSPSLVLQALSQAASNAHISVNDVPIWLIWPLGYLCILCYMAARVLGNPSTYLQDGRYFVFFTFVIIAWFFVAVFTHPQWWMFLVPAALLTLDSFKNKAGIVACVGILIVYPVYPMLWEEIAVVITSYHVPAAIFTGTHLAWISAVLADAVLASLLLFWIFASKRELDSTIS
jgi:hypothetical protein